MSPRRVGVDVAGPAVDLGVAEAVEGEARLPLLAAGRRRGCSRRSTAALAQRAGAELAVLQHLGGAHRAPSVPAGRPRRGCAGARRGSGRSRGCAAPLGVGEHRDGRDLLGAADRRARCGATRVAGSRSPTATGAQPASSKPGRATSPAAPGGRRSARRRRCRCAGSGRAPPARRRRWRSTSTRAVRVGHLELGEQREVVAVEVAEPAVASRAGRGTSRRRARRRSRSSPGPQQVGDVVGVVAQPVLVGPSSPGDRASSPTRCAVDLDLVEAVGGHVEASARRVRSRP